jgi:hypothetical protein
VITAPANFLTANAALVKQPIFLIEIAGYTRAFTNVDTGIAGQYPWLGVMEDHVITINDLDGGADLGQLIFAVQDRGGLITADFPGFVFEGKTLTLKTGLVGMDQADFTLLFTGTISAVDSVNNNTEYAFTTDDPRQELAGVIYTLSDDGVTPTDSSHAHTVNAHPLDILLDILENQLGIDPTLVDVAKFTTYRDTIYGGAQFTFNITSAPAAKDFIENELMKPLGGYLRVNNLGQITADFFYPIVTTPAMALNVDNLLEAPEAGQAPLINQVSVRFDYDDNDKNLAEDVEQDAASIAKYGTLYGQQIIESRGLRSGLGGTFLAALVARLIFLRYGDKQLTFDANGGSGSSQASANGALLLWNTCVLEPGDFVTVTHPQVPDRTLGVMGITGQTFVVMDRTWKFSDCTVLLKLLAVDIAIFHPYLITSNSEGSYTAVSGTDQTTFMFQANDSDEYSTGAPANTLG